MHNNILNNISLVKKYLILYLTILILFLPVYTYAQDDKSNEADNNIQNVKIVYKKDEQKEIADVPKIGCKYVYIAEPKTGKVIYEKNSHEKAYPASTTKILTALLALEKCKPQDEAVVSKEALALVPDGYSNAQLKVGEKITISDLLYALLVPSANEAANVIAEHVSGSVEEFAQLCNNRAKELGCETLHFVNPNGIHNDDHYCSAYDLYLIAKECQKYELFNKIVKTKTYTLPATNAYSKSDRTLKNTNLLLFPQSKEYYYSYCTGIKTGHTTPAGECLVASSSYENMDLISVVLGGKTNSKGLNERFTDTKELFEFAYNNYSVKKILENKQVIKTIEVAKATKETAQLDVVSGTEISTIVPNDIDKDNIKTSILIDENLTAPIQQNQKVGEITLYADGLEYTAELLASHMVEKKPYFLYNSIVVFALGIIILIIIKVSKKF